MSSVQEAVTLPYPSVTIPFCSRAALQDNLHVDQEISLPISTNKTLRTGLRLNSAFLWSFCVKRGLIVSLSERNGVVCPFQRKAESSFALKITSRSYSNHRNTGDLDSELTFVWSYCSGHLPASLEPLGFCSCETGEILLWDWGDTPVSASLWYSVGKRDPGASSCFIACSAFSSQGIKYHQNPLGNCDFSPTTGSGITGSLMFAFLDGCQRNFIKNNGLMVLKDLYREVATERGFSGSEFWITIQWQLQPLLFWSCSIGSFRSHWHKDGQKIIIFM